VTFFNEETGFSVLKVRVKGHRDEVCVVGSLPAANPGEWLTAEGQWVQDRQFGQQFRAHLLASAAPSTREGIEKYLGSGLIRGIGPVYARKLVAAFGEKIFDIIENQSARLQDVEGIGPNRRREIKSAWAEQKVIRQIMVFLHSNGVGTSRAVRIFKTYGENAIEKVRENPYRLAQDIPGIGFKTADQVAQKMGIPFDSLLRAEAGLRHVLLTATDAGHCALPLETLREEAAKMLLVQDSVVESAFERALLARELALETVGDEKLVFLPRLQRAEQSVAARVQKLCATAPGYPEIHFDRALAWVQERTGKQLAPSQCEALKEALTRRMLVLTGGPGVGKTTLINSLLQILRAKKVNCVLCAPTGRAARRLSDTTGLPAKTIHRLLEVDPRQGGFTRNEGNPLECDLLVVDETSMVDLPLMHSLLRALPQNAGLLLVGDVDQLPSVGPGMVLRNLIESGIVPVVRLTEVFRQAANSRIITSAHQINQGRVPETPGDDALSDFYLVQRDLPERIVATVLEMVKSRIPKKFGLDPLRDVQVLAPMNRGLLGVQELNLRLQAELNPPRPDRPEIEKFSWRFRVGDKVMQTENDYDKDVFNGDIGQVLRVDQEQRELVARFDNREVTYAFGELDELVLAYAITIHKSQGSEFPAVILPLATQHYLLLQRNLLYTGVTRGKQLVVIVGQQKAVAMAVRNNRTEQRYSGLLHRLRHQPGAVE
jgi:exodeoxyribonuclease V alpha subunit